MCLREKMTLLRPGAYQKQRIRQSRTEATVRTDGRKTTKLPTTVDDELAIKTGQANPRRVRRILAESLQQLSV